ncbi:uncharacterized protein LOC115903694 [Camarhynchus parvulus]|uniref:uncharacterized protein LOC115903694 n=1 Tax=Geospiza parvula TaxID=87175 RepID=UPI001237B634|nr:uncharacterized protein LOC115903694 [Camarhynchus parvulus]
MAGVDEVIWSVTIIPEQLLVCHDWYCCTAIVVLSVRCVHWSTKNLDLGRPPRKATQASLCRDLVEAGGSPGGLRRAQEAAVLLQRGRAEGWRVSGGVRLRRPGTRGTCPPQLLVPDDNAGSRGRSCSALTGPLLRPGAGSALSRLRRAAVPAAVPAAAAMEEQKENRPQAARDEAAAAAAARPPGRQHCKINDQETNGKTSAATSNDFSDPIYKEIAITNGYINRMTREELRSKLAEFKLETR